MELIIKGSIVFIDDEDFCLVDQYTWRIHSQGYVIAHKLENGKDRTISMHRLVMGVLDRRYPVVDHKNGNPKDNRKSNLRFASFKENARNLKPRGRSKYLGVCYIKPFKGRYEYIKASICLNGKRVHLGLFETEELAAVAYNEAAKKHYGEFANLNNV